MNFIAPLCLLPSLVLAQVATAPPVRPSNPVAKRVTAPKATKKPNLGKVVGPRRLEGGRFHYADSHADYIFRFEEQGKYNVAWVHKGGQDHGYREGTFTWTRTSRTKATLQLDDEFWTLTFGKSHRAEAYTTDDVRPTIWFWEE